MEVETARKIIELSVVHFQQAMVVQLQCSRRESPANGYARALQAPQ